MQEKARIYATLLAEWGYEKVKDRKTLRKIGMLFHRVTGPPIYMIGQERYAEGLLVRTDFVYEPHGRSVWVRTQHPADLCVPFETQDGTVAAYEANAQLPH